MPSRDNGENVLEGLSCFWSGTDYIPLEHLVLNHTHKELKFFKTKLMTYHLRRDPGLKYSLPHTCSCVYAVLTAEVVVDLVWWTAEKMLERLVHHHCIPLEF